ncbi:MAG: cytochrome P450 [Cyanobacteria bacterium P01_D01_bin.115]
MPECWGLSRRDPDQVADRLHEHKRDLLTIAQLDATIYAMIDYRRQTEHPGNELLGMFMQVVDADDGSRMTDQQLRDEAATLMLAGHETTANTLAWTWPGLTH